MLWRHEHPASFSPSEFESQYRLAAEPLREVVELIHRFAGDVYSRVVGGFHLDGELDASSAMSRKEVWTGHPRGRSGGGRSNDREPLLPQQPCQLPLVIYPPWHVSIHHLWSIVVLNIPSTGFIRPLKLTSSLRNGLI